MIEALVALQAAALLALVLFLARGQRGKQGEPEAPVEQGLATEVARPVTFVALPEDVVRVFPDLSFWYGLNAGDLLNMPRFMLDEYMDALSRLQSQYQVFLNAAAAYPWLDKSERRRVERRLGALAGSSAKSGKAGEDERVLTAAAGLGIGVMRQ